MEQVKGTLTISADYFRNAVRKTYGSRVEWIIAREFVQNGVDADSENIYFQVENADGCVKLSVLNDGRTISREDLLGKLLSIGGTSKTGSGGTVGGFGVAKDILYFCHQKYVIESGQYRVEGSAAEYTLTDDPSVNQEGFYSEVWMAPDIRADILQDKIKAFVASCDCPATIRLNGEVLPQNLKCGDRLHINEAGTLFHQNARSEFSESMRVRVNGVTMFSRYIGDEVGECVFEIDPHRSREILTVNREGFVGDLADELDRIIHELVVNPKMATRKPRVVETLHFGAKGYIDTSKLKEAAKLNTNNDTDASLFDVLKEICEERSPAAAQQVMKELNIVESIHSEMATVWMFPHFLVYEDKKSGFGLRGKEPGTWNRRYQRMAKTWEYVVTQVLLDAGIDTVFGIGFCFETGTAAMYKNHNSIEWFLLNPCEGTENLTTQNDWSEELLDRAIHEVAHKWGDYHNETFVMKIEWLRRQTRKNPKIYKGIPYRVNQEIR